MNLRKTIVPISAALLVGGLLTLLLSISWLGASRADMMDFIKYFSISGVLTIAVGVAGVFWLRRGAVRFWIQIAVALAIGVGLALFNIFLTAQLMFISADHDLLLLVLLVLFASCVSLGLGYVLARTLAQRVDALASAARAVADGDLAARVPALGNDELGVLGREFNRMAERLASAEADRAQQEAARRELFAAISHDLRTPLAALRSLNEALADGLVPDAATEARYHATMAEQIGYLDRLIGDLFDLARLEAGVVQLETRPTPPAELLGGVLAGLAPTADAKGVTLAIGPEIAGLAVLAEPQQVTRVLYNLVGNAIRHTPAGGHVTLAAQPAAGQGVRFEVTDTGEGIAAEELERVFERFYRSERSRSRSTGGAGLGLAIARGIVAAHGGTIWAARNEPHGARFCFTLPVAA